VCSARLAAAAALVLAAFVASAADRRGDKNKPTKPTPLGAEEQAARAAAAPRWRLQSTLVADTRRLAVINGRTVAQGGRIEGATLVEVRQDGVTLEEDGRRIRLRLLRETPAVKSGGG
jgi:MSHA biogenesis protein MshK